MVENNIDVGLLIKKSFKSIRYDPGYIVLFLPIVLMTIIFYVVIQMFFVNDFLTMIQSIQSSGFNTMSQSALSEFTNLVQEKMWILAVIIIFYGIALIIASTAVYASVIKKVESEEKGEKITVSDAFSRGLPVVPRLLISTLLVVLIIGVPIGVLVGLIILGVVSNAVYIICFSSLIMILLIIPLIYFAIRLSLFAPACVIDNFGSIDSLKRSWRITKGNVLLIFVTAIIIGIMAFAIMAPFIAINSVTSANQFKYSGYTYNLVGSVANLIGQVIVQLIISPVSIIIYTLIYLNLSKKHMINTEIGKKETLPGPVSSLP